MNHQSPAETTALQSEFIEKAAQAAQTAPIVEGDPAASQLLAEARSLIYHWPADFAGFEARLLVLENEHTFTGHVKARSSRACDVQLDGYEHLKWVRYQLEELIAHREAPQVSQMSSRTGVVFGDWNAIYGRKVTFLGDRMQSFYRIKDRKLTQIGRSYNGLSFVINIDQHQEFEGQFVSTHYTVFYVSTATNQLAKVETFFDRYQEVNGLLLPAERRYTLVEGHEGGMTTRSLLFQDVTQL